VAKGYNIRGGLKRKKVISGEDDAGRTGEKRHSEWAKGSGNAEKWLTAK